MDALTRREQYYSAMAGEGTSVPEPVTREEQYLKKIVDEGGGGGGLPAGGTEGQVLTMGPDSPGWANIPTELPDGGTAGQVLTKGASGVGWGDVPTELPAGGTNGQVLTKGANGVSWANVPTELPSGGTTGKVLVYGQAGPEWGDVSADGSFSFDSDRYDTVTSFDTTTQYIKQASVYRKSGQYETVLLPESFTDGAKYLTMLIGGAVIALEYVAGSNRVYLYYNEADFSTSGYPKFESPVLANRESGGGGGGGSTINPCDISEAYDLELMYSITAYAGNFAYTGEIYCEATLTPAAGGTAVTKNNFVLQAGGIITISGGAISGKPVLVGVPKDLEFDSIGGVTPVTFLIDSKAQIKNPAGGSNSVKLVITHPAQVMYNSTIYNVSIAPQTNAQYQATPVVQFN